MACHSLPRISSISALCTGPKPSSAAPSDCLELSAGCFLFGVCNATCIPRNSKRSSGVPESSSYLLHSLILQQREDAMPSEGERKLDANHAMPCNLLWNFTQSDFLLSSKPPLYHLCLPSFAKWSEPARNFLKDNRSSHQPTKMNEASWASFSLSAPSHSSGEGLV